MSNVLDVPNISGALEIAIAENFILINESEKIQPDKPVAVPKQEEAWCWQQEHKNHS
jgi:hypothetical protein